ncbi:MAG: hypothetical protein E7065_00130 [Lentimicrobiaceae bacterium]|nr:hypothetical protein [Lentimicrobiaceae bacterium]
MTNEQCRHTAAETYHQTIRDVISQCFGIDITRSCTYNHCICSTCSHEFSKCHG